MVGDSGDTGPQGPTGPRGETGDTGATGVQRQQLIKRRVAREIPRCPGDTHRLLCCVDHYKLTPTFNLLGK